MFFCVWNGKAGTTHQPHKVWDVHLTPSCRQEAGVRKSVEFLNYIASELSLLSRHLAGVASELRSTITKDSKSP